MTPGANGIGTASLEPQPAPNAQSSAPEGFQEQTVPHTDPNTGLVGFSEQGAGVQPTRWEQFLGRAQQAAEQAPLGTPDHPGFITRYIEQQHEQDLNAIEGEQKLSAEDANKQFPGMPEPFKEPVYPGVARLLWNRNEKRRALEDWISAGPQTAGPVMSFAAGLAPSILDPVNLALSLGTAGASRALGMASTVRNIFLQNLAINTATEIPNALQQQREQQTVTLPDEIKQVLTSSVAGTALGKAFHLVLEAGAEKLKGLSESAREQLLKTALAQKEAGGKVDVSPQERMAAAREAGVLPPGVEPAPYTFTPVEHPSERSYYAGSSAETGAAVPLGDYGPGLYASDRGEVANHAASNPEGAPGQVHELGVKEEAKFLDLEAPASEGEGKAFIQEIEAKTGIKLALPEDATVKDALAMLAREADKSGVRAEALQDAQAVAREKGYDGYRYVAEHPQLGTADNRIVAFGPESVEQRGRFDANPEITPKVTPETLQSQLEKAASPDGSPRSDSELDQKIERQQYVPQRPEGAQLDPVVQARAEAAEAYLKSAAQESPEIKQEIAEDLNKEKALDSQEKQLAEDMTNCLTGNIT